MSVGCTGAMSRFGAATLDSLPQSKSAVADFDRSVECRNLRIRGFRCGGGMGSGGVQHGAAVPLLPTPIPCSQGGEEEIAVPANRILARVRVARFSAFLAQLL